MGSKSRKGSPSKRRSNSRHPTGSTAGSDVGNADDLESPKKGIKSPRKSRQSRGKSPQKEMTNGDNSDEGVSSATTTTRTLSTAATDLTTSSGFSSQPPGSNLVEAFF